MGARMTSGILDIPEEEYRSLDAINISSLKNLRQSPAHYLWFKDKGMATTPAMLLGTRIHKRLLEPDLFDDEYHLGLDVRRGSKQWKEEQEKAGSKTVLKPQDFFVINEVQNNFLNNKIAVDLLSGGKPEVSACALHPKYDVLMKCRVDYLKDDAIVDLKTTNNFETFRKNIGSNGLHLQLAWYGNIISLIRQKKIENYYLVVIETMAPYCVYTCQVNHSAITIAQVECEELLEQYIKCDKEKSWPGPKEELINLDLEHWYVPCLPKESENHYDKR